MTFASRLENLSTNLSLQYILECMSHKIAWVTSCQKAVRLSIVDSGVEVIPPCEASVIFFSLYLISPMCALRPKSLTCSNVYFDFPIIIFIRSPFVFTSHHHTVYPRLSLQLVEYPACT
jgi:hypothetical protein